MIHLCLAFRDSNGQYSKHAAVLLQSIFMHTQSPICVHLLHDETLEETNKQRLTEMVEDKGHRLIFYLVQLPDDFVAAVSHTGRIKEITLAAYYRIMLPHLADVEKMIYLDCDILVTMDIKHLWNIELYDYYLAAAQDKGIERFPEVLDRYGFKADNYFNSGVLLLSLDNIRRNEGWYERILDFFIRFPNAAFDDQDALNYVFGSNYLKLDSEYNTLLGSLVYQNDETKYLNKIIHFTGYKKAWNTVFRGAERYWDYLEMTPWKTELKKDLVKIGQEYADFILLAREIMNERPFVMFGTGAGCEKLFRVFNLNVVYYVDNNQQKWNTPYRGRMVYSPEHLIADPNDEIIVGIASQYSYEITKQLREMGCRHRVVDFRPFISFPAEIIE